MKKTDIFDQWGTIIEFDDPMEFFSYDKNFWRSMAYVRKLLIFKRMAFGLANYGKFGFYFGCPWTLEDYKYSYEPAFVVRDQDNEYIVTKFSNFNTTKTGARSIGAREMPWHADIPNRSVRPFPFRSLYMDSDQYVLKSGQTQWLNVEDYNDQLPPRLKDLIPHISIRQQSWYDGGQSDVSVYNFIKIHPVTGQQSLRLNYYVGYPGSQNSSNAWIRNVLVDGVEQKDCSLIQEYIDALLQIKNTFHRHQWDRYDIAIYDNYSFVHGRTRLNLYSESNVQLERTLYRMNIDHVLDSEWNLNQKI